MLRILIHIVERNQYLRELLKQKVEKVHELGITCQSTDISDSLKVFGFEAIHRAETFETI